MESYRVEVQYFNNIRAFNFFCLFAALKMLLVFSETPEINVFVPKL